MDSAVTTSRIPQIRVTGNARDRGFQYGELVREKVHRSQAAYQETFENAAGWSWSQAIEASLVLVPSVAEAFPHCLEEMRGIAEGSGLTFEDIFTMNARTEVLWSATIRKTDQERARLSKECSAFALLPPRTADAHTWIGQNWDWLVHSRDTVIILEVEQQDAPNFVTVVEAGLLAKSSMNSAGLAVAVNTLVTSADRGAPGIPYHVLIRALADCESLADAIATASRHMRSSSGNYLLGHMDGLAVNLETAPGGYEAITATLPQRDSLVHTNHFVAGVPGQTDAAHYAMPDSLIRLQQVQRSIAEAEEPATLNSLRAALSDHADYPSSVCCHPDPRDPHWDQWATVASVVFDLDARQLHITEGNPCVNDFRSYDFGNLLAPPPELSAQVS